MLEKSLTFDLGVKKAIAEAAKAAQLHTREGLDAIALGVPFLRARRNHEATTVRQFDADLDLISGIADPGERESVLRAWLDRAQALATSEGFAALQSVRQRVFGEQWSFAPIDPQKQFPERIVIRDETLPVAFLEQGTRATASVGKMEVPVFRGGARDIAAHARGTAWLLSPKHVVTCLHVLHARDPGQRATATDLDAQVAAASVSFDQATSFSTKSIAVAWEDLDVAVVELAAPVADPQPLVCRAAVPPNPTPELSFYVNLVQFPRGEAKRVGLRANAAVEVSERDIFYFTDTEQGSSGSPCFDDSWNVIAVHRAWEVRRGLQYMGRVVGFANVGTLITKVLTRLQAQHPDIHREVRIG